MGTFYVCLFNLYIYYFLCLWEVQDIVLYFWLICNLLYRPGWPPAFAPGVLRLQASATMPSLSSFYIFSTLSDVHLELKWMIKKTFIENAYVDYQRRILS